MNIVFKVLMYDTCVINNIISITITGYLFHVTFFADNVICRGSGCGSVVASLAAQIRTRSLHRLCLKNNTCRS